MRTSVCKAKVKAGDIKTKSRVSSVNYKNKKVSNKLILMRPETTAPSLAAFTTQNCPAVVYPWRPAGQQETAHILWGELLYYLVRSRYITV